MANGVKGRDVLWDDKGGGGGGGGGGGCGGGGGGGMPSSPMVWDDRGGGGGMPSSSTMEMQQQPNNLVFDDSGNENIHHVDFSFKSNNEEEASMGSYFKSPQHTSRSSYEEGGTSKRSKLSHQGESVESSDEESAPLGLKLRKTPSFINLIERELNARRQRTTPTPTPTPSSSRQQQQKMKEKEQSIDKEEKLDNERLKASNFPALFLRIGDWEFPSEHEGDLVAKCYYKKGRLVWEILKGSLKSKIEIQWTDIIGIRATKAEDECGILEIELNEKPLFFKETNPQPRKHTLWQQADDFTEGAALKYRRHCIKVAPGTLEKHYERLLQNDQRLSLLSQRPFPSKHSPYFPNVFGFQQFSLDFNGHQSHIHPMAQYPFNQNFQASMASPPFQIVRQTAGPPQIAFLDSNPTMPVSNYMVLDNQNIAFLNEATNIPNGNYVQVARPVTSSAMPNNINFPNYPLNMGFPKQDYIHELSQGTTGLSTANTALLGIQNHLLAGVHDNMQTMNDRTVLARANPMMLPVEIVSGGRMINDLPEPPMIQNNIGENSTTPNDGGSGLVWSDSSNWLTQYKGVGGIQPSTSYNAFYPYGLQNQTNGNF